MDAHREPPRAPRPKSIEVFPQHAYGDSFVLMSSEESPARSSFQSVSSDYSPVASSISTPATVTTTWMSSSNSSIASSPLAFDQFDLNSSNTFTKRSAPVLPDVQEHPLELDDHQERARFDSANALPFGRDYSARISLEQLPSPRDLHAGTWGVSNSGSEMRCEPSPKRRRSGALDSITSRIFTSLPSLKHHKGRKRNLISRSEGSSGVSSPVVLRSRSNSHTHTSTSNFQNSDAMDVDGANDSHANRVSERIETIDEDDSQDPTAGLEPFHPTTEGARVCKPEDLQRVQTPLLPMLMDETPSREPDVQSLEPPRTVDSGIGDLHYDSAGSIQHTPQLSAKPSTNFAKSPLSTKVSNDAQDHKVSGMSILAAPEDQWSDKLGHANFFIRPTPYLPDDCSAEACSTLLADWEKARSEYSKHLARTGKHFGHGSRTYCLTEEKWHAVDVTWKHNYDQVRAMASFHGEVPPSSPTEPAPVVKIPSLDDKFPQLSDFEVVGAMERVEPPARASTQIKRDSSMRSGFKKLMGGLNKRSRSVSVPQ